MDRNTVCPYQRTRLLDHRRRSTRGSPAHKSGATRRQDDSAEVARVARVTRRLRVAPSVCVEKFVLMDARHLEQFSHQALLYRPSLMNWNRQVSRMACLAKDLVAARGPHWFPAESTKRPNNAGCIEFVKGGHFACFFLDAVPMRAAVIAAIASRIMRRASVMLSPCETHPTMSVHSTTHPPSSRSGS